MKASRVPNGLYAAAIGEAFDRLPPAMALRLDHVRFVCGVAPLLWWRGPTGTEIRK